MIKIVFTWKDNPNIPLRQSEEHYRKVHTKMAVEGMKASDGVIAYVQSRVVKSTIHDYNNPVGRPGPPDFDRMVDIYVENEEVAARFLNPEALRNAFDDHPNFMNVDIPGSLKVYVVEETIPFQRNFRVN